VVIAVSGHHSHDLGVGGRILDSGLRRIADQGWPSLTVASAALVMARGLRTAVAGRGYHNHAAVVEALNGLLQGGTISREAEAHMTTLTNGLPLL
jgi:hypothetical protein